MSRIDWSKAPVCAEAAIVAKPNNRHAPKTVYVREYSANNCEIIGVDIDGAAINALSDYWELVERPSSPAWNGEGLPPVGTVCEAMRQSIGSWEKVKILCLGESRVFFKDRHGYEMSRCYREIQFRPIRTHEQIAAEDREKAVQEMHDLVGDIEQVPTWTDALRKLYDNGYRKTEG